MKNKCVACGHRMQYHIDRWSNETWVTYACTKCNCGIIGHKV